ncbi:hypothetical protein [Kangiella sp. TOML190]|uniref:hypothetical protein n=1 Tax=Kangiella sp. TOML190 TaxID=2931351 RepID=UPI00203D2D89|nr:hypothetical protein [Kangiella sp. TOML190]
MFIVIKNQAEKSFNSRLEALKRSYQFSIVKSDSEENSEVFYLKLGEAEDLLTSFAQDAKFGFGNHLFIERISKIPD